MANSLCRFKHHQKHRSAHGGEGLPTLSDLRAEILLSDPAIDLSGNHCWRLFRRTVSVEYLYLVFARKHREAFVKLALEEVTRPQELMPCDPAPGTDEPFKPRGLLARFALAHDGQGLGPCARHEADCFLNVIAIDDAICVALVAL